MSLPEVKIERDIERVEARANETGVMIVGAWTVGIHRNDAIRYVQEYDQSPDAGFFEHDGSVILTHRDSKITLSKAEAQALIDLINAAYLGPQPAF